MFAFRYIFPGSTAMLCSSPTGVGSTGTAVGLSPTRTGALPCTMGISICDVVCVLADGVRQIAALTFMGRGYTDVVNATTVLADTSR